ncbi:MAG: response regulator [Betaproteobacteria bacterium]
MAHKLLLADDSVTIQRVIELTFADEDVQVVAVSDGDQAVARLESDTPDIVLADVGMPGRDGYQVAEYVKASPRLSHIPVVLLTGAFEPIDEGRASAIGCDGVLAKPFEPQLVISRVRELLGRPAGRPGHADDRTAEPPRPAAQTPPTRAENLDLDGLDAYFDRLDEAFAARTSTQAETPPSPIVDQIDWFAAREESPAVPPAEDRREATTQPVQAVHDIPLSYASPAPGVAGPSAPEPAAPSPAPAAAPEPAPSIAARASAQAPAAPDESAAASPAPALASAAALPSLSDAFAALLAAEQGSPDAILRWPPSEPAAPTVPDDLIEDVTKRVLERLTDRVVRETASQIVPGVAERLVREEIERIKASVQ